MTLVILFTSHPGHMTNLFTGKPLPENEKKK